MQPEHKPPYKLRFFFDAGSGTCLWAANDAARERFGYDINVDDLPLTSETKNYLEALLHRYDESVDWEHPSGPTPWSERECDEFNRQAEEAVRRLRSELDAEYELRNEYRPIKAI